MKNQCETLTKKWHLLKQTNKKQQQHQNKMNDARETSETKLSLYPFQQFPFGSYTPLCFFFCFLSLLLYVVFFCLIQIVVDSSDEKEWLIYDAGPRNVRCPLVCLPPASGTADVFFKQILTLSSLGYRVISVSFLQSKFIN